MRKYRKNTRTGIWEKWEEEKHYDFIWKKVKAWLILTAIISTLVLIITMILGVRT